MLKDYFLLHGLAENEPRVLLPFHEQICNALDDVIAGQLPDGKTNLLILIPPRHGKTFLIRDFVSYSLGLFPDSEFIYVSYASELAVTQTRHIRSTIQKDWYKERFDFSLAKEGDAYFTTDRGGIVFGVGVGGPIAGFGAGKKRPQFGGGIILDDVLKSDDARSAMVKQHLLEWYNGVLTSRKNHKDTPIVGIMQRLAPDDLVGHILKTEPEKWHVIKIPGLQPDGTALWEQTKSAADLKKLKKVDPFAFYAQYQQQPQVEGGNIIKKDWWRFYRTKGKDANGKEINYYVNGFVFLTADTAMKTKTMNDYTELQAWHATGQYLDLLDEEYGRWEFPEMLRRAKAFWDKWAKWKARAFFIEDKVSGTSLGQTLIEQGIPAVLWKPQDYYFPEDKVGRVMHSTWYIEAGRVRLPFEKKAIYRRIIEECAAFNGDDSVNDDVVDALTMALSVWTYKGGGHDVKAG